MNQLVDVIRHIIKFIHFEDIEFLNTQTEESDHEHQRTWRAGSLKNWKWIIKNTGQKKFNWYQKFIHSFCIQLQKSSTNHFAVSFSSMCGSWWMLEIGNSL